MSETLAERLSREKETSRTKEAAANNEKNEVALERRANAIAKKAAAAAEKKKAAGEHEVEADFGWVHYDNPCSGATCRSGSESCFSIHSLKLFEPARLKGLAGSVYEKLRAPPYGFKVEVVNTSDANSDGFRFKIVW